MLEQNTIKILITIRYIQCVGSGFNLGPIRIQIWFPEENNAAKTHACTNVIYKSIPVQIR